MNCPTQSVSSLSHSERMILTSINLSVSAAHLPSRSFVALNDIEFQAPPNPHSSRNLFSFSFMCFRCVSMGFLETAHIKEFASLRSGGLWDVPRTVSRWSIRWSYLRRVSKEKYYTKVGVPTAAAKPPAFAAPCA